MQDTESPLREMMTKAITAWVLLVSFSAQTAAQDSCSYYGDVRLVGGSNEREGRVEVCILGVWGTVCDDGWDFNDARVVCRQLGFEVDVPRTNPSAYSRARYGQGTGPIYLDNLRCTGQESSLLDCRNEIGNIRSCSHTEDAGVRCPSTTCTDDGIRLAGGLDPTEGRVEVCVGGRWRGVCQTYWNYQDAFVVCRQLGYPATGAVAYSSSSALKFGRSVDTYFNYFRCHGSELHLLRCTHSVGTCNRDYMAGVLCYGDVVPVSPQCHGNGNVRLVGGAHTNEGRVEVCVNGMWGTVCDYSWDSRDATVVCKQLGYLNPYAYAYTSSSAFGAGSGPIFWQYVNCQGTEHSIQECSSSSNAYHCSHSSDVGVRCEREVYSGCTHRTIRLAGGQSANEGRVEICINGVWGTVCDDSWDSTDARVVCRGLGLPYTGAVAYSDAYFGSGSGPYHLDDVRCRGSEVSLLSCSHSAIGVHNCRPGNEAGVKCVAPTCAHGNIRLAGGKTSYEGRVEICLHGYWASVCQSNSGNVNESTVVCRQLTKEQNPLNSVIRYPSNIFGGGSHHIRYINHLSCNGWESQLLSCSYTPVYYSCTPLGVRCYVNSGCVEGEVRLAGGESEMEGRVEVCHNQTWWAVSGRSYYWNIRDATVVCKHLHYPSNRVIPLFDEHFGRGNATIMIQDFGCTGSEETLRECRSSNYSISSYYSWGYDLNNRGKVASVICQSLPATTQPECFLGDLRLVGGERETEGRVEICVEGFWGTVCDSGWGTEEAFVVCKQLGMKTSGAIPAYFGDGSGLVLRGISCTGTESDVTECNIGQSDCQNLRNFGVICQDIVYTVSVVTDPPSGPHLIGSTVNLTCLVQPQLPEEEVTYQWRDYFVYTSPVVANSSLPYATTSIGIGHPHTARYYCQVYYRNILLASGSTVITVQGLLHPVGPTSVRYASQEMVTLQVNVTSSSAATFTRDYLRLLTWYYNGVEIVPTSGGAISLSSDNTTLTVANTSSSCSGVYEVRFAGLRVYPYNYLCERETLAILRRYPLLSSVTFYVYNNSENAFESSDEEASTRDKFRLTPSSGSLPYTTADNIYITLSGNLPVTQRDFVYSSWYFNGLSSLPVATSVQSLLKLPTGITQSLTIHDPTSLHAGTYEALLRLDPVSYLRQFGCPDEYPNFIQSYGLRVSRIVIEKFAIDLIYYEPATVSLQSSRSALWDNENTTLSCITDGGYPTSNISWVKNDRIISTTNTSILTINIAANDTQPFGRYVCVVKNALITTENSLLLKQKGDFQIELNQSSYGGCDTLNNVSIDVVEEGVAGAIQEMCSCNFAPSDMEESQVTCSADNNALIFTTTIIYSSESGNLTASTLIQMFSDSTNLCSPTCAQPSNVAAIVGACLGSLVFVLILIAAAVIICSIALRRRKVSSDIQLRTSEAAAAEKVRYSTGGSVVQLGQNVAYNTVEYPDEEVYEYPST